jgi:peptidyl-prolyl cis-trans isomerase SurA
VSVARVAWFTLALVLVRYAPAEAQDSAFVLVDRVAAVVGDVVIPMTRVDEELNVYRQQGGEVPTDSMQLILLKRELLENLVSQELLVQAALRDTMVEVTDQDVQQSVEQALGEIRGQFGSDTEFERQLRAANFGSLDEYRQWLTEQQRRELLRRQYMQRLRERGELEPLQPTEEEMRAFYEQTKAQQPQRPATLTFRQIVIRSDPDTAALREAFQLADSIKVALREGADFDLTARQFSDDPGSRERGGDLGWVRRGMLVTEFESVAFRLRPGVISEPVHSVFGFHIIRVDRRQPGEVMVRHILIAPTITEADRARSRATADSVLQALRDGAPVDSLTALYHDRAGQEQALVEDFPQDRLPAEYQAPLEGRQPGEWFGPIVLDRGDGRPKYAVVLFQNYRPAGPFSYEDLRDRLRSTLAEQNAMERLIQSLREATYIETRL